MTAEKVELLIDGDHYVLEGEQVDEMERIGREAPSPRVAWKNLEAYARRVNNE